MREYLVFKIIYLLLCNGGGNPQKEMDLNNSRFLCVYQKYIDMIAMPHFKSYRGKLVLTEEDLAELGDGQLVDLFELVVIRANRCM